MILPDIKPYSWLDDAIECLAVPRPDAPLLTGLVGPLANEARPFSLPPYPVSDPPFKGYLFESEPAVSTLEKYRQPFPVIALQFPIVDGEYRIPTVAIVTHDEEKQVIKIAQASKLPGRSNWAWLNSGVNIRVDGTIDINKLTISPWPFSNRPTNFQETQEAANAMHPATMAAFELGLLLQCQNISILHLEAPPKVNEKRKRNGKRPLPGGYVICVARDVTRRQYDQVEETQLKREHASPRTHFRRGHIRRLQSGATVWVSPTMVNPGNAPLRSAYQVLF